MALQFRLADLAIELEAARLFLYSAAAAYDRGDADKTPRIAMAKRFVTDTGFEVANGALQLLGVMAISPNMASRRSCVICAFTRSSKAPTRSCG